MRKIKIIALGICLVLVVLSAVVCFNYFRVREATGMVNSPSELPLIGEYVKNISAEGALPYKVVTQGSARIVYFGGNMNLDQREYIDDPNWSTLDSKGFEDNVKPIGQYSVRISPDNIVLCRPLLKPKDRFQITIYYMPSDNSFLGTAISTRP
jgi:hypothetical protein